MVDKINRDKNDIYGMPILGFLFKNPKFLLTLKLSVFALFLYAMTYGFINTSSENVFTKGVFGIYFGHFLWL